MSPDLLFGLAWKSSICAGLTLLVLRGLRGRSAAERLDAAHLGMLTTVLTPFAAVALRPLTRPLELPRVLEPAASFATLQPAGPPSVLTVGSPVQTFGGAPDTLASIDVGALASWLYGVPAVLLALVLAVSVVRLQALRSRARLVVDPAWLTALASTQQRFGFKHGTALLVSAEITSPVSWGVLRPVVIIDEETSAEPGKAEAVIAHELAHLARLDWAKLLLGGVATALFWFNPLVRILARRCHDLREEAADDAVLRGDIAPADYADLLVGCARRESSALLAANGVAPARGSVARRVRRVLDPSRRGGPARAGWTLVCCAAALTFAAPLALTYAPASGVVVTAAAAAQRSQAGARPAPASPRAASPARLAPGRGVDARGSGSASQSPPIAATLAIAEDSARGWPNRTAPVLEEALVQAAGRGDVTAMDALLKAGVSPDAVAPGDGSPLIEAARTGRADMVRTLLAHGADIDLAVDGDGNPLIAAAAAGRTDMVRILLDAGADIEASMPSDENALIQASGRGHEDVVRLLLARGADVNARVGPRTPLRMARSRGHANIERLLLEAGANP